jgi:hypothetical protein
LNVGQKGLPEQWKKGRKKGLGKEKTRVQYNPNFKKTNGLKDRRTDGQTDRRTDEQTNRQTQ